MKRIVWVDFHLGMCIQTYEGKGFYIQSKMKTFNGNSADGNNEGLSPQEFLKVMGYDFKFHRRRYWQVRIRA